MNTMKAIATYLTALTLLCGAARASAAVVHIEMHGSVEWNEFIDGPLVTSVVHPGDLVVLAFDVDSDSFVDPPFFPPPQTCHTRGYPLIPGSFTFRIGSVDVPLTDPMPNNEI